MIKLQRMFNGNRDEASDVSTHRKLDPAVRAAHKLLRGIGQGWGVRVLVGGKEIDLAPEYRRLGLE